jgi:hypothetical protein
MLSQLILMSFFFENKRDVSKFVEFVNDCGDRDVSLHLDLPIDQDIIRDLKTVQTEKENELPKH